MMKVILVSSTACHGSLTYSQMIVTKEEAVWESFSEDEPVAQAPKPKPAAAGSMKGKKANAKPGQGNIMSFFGKKA